MPGTILVKLVFALWTLRECVNLIVEGYQTIRTHCWPSIMVKPGPSICILGLPFFPRITAHAFLVQELMKVKLWLLRLQFWFIKDCNKPAGRWPWMWIHIWSNLSDMTRFCRKCKVLQIDPLWFLECLSAVYHRKQYKTLETESNLDIGLVLSMHLHVNTYRSNRNYSATSAGEK